MKRRVLLIEDHPASAKLVRDVLVRAGYDVMCAANAEAGIVLAREWAPELVVMDIHLPGMDGIEVAARLKWDVSTTNIPLVALTAQALDGDASRLLDAGFCGYLAKPMRYKELLALVLELIGASPVDEPPTDSSLLN